MVEWLSDFPWMIVRIDCPLCLHRKGQYRLARLAEKHRADNQLRDLIDRVAFDCSRKSLPWERPSDQYDPRCKARFIDLDAPSRPPDLPSMMRKLRVILGEKH